MPTLHFNITGRVQHVWFRGWTQLTARGLGLTGWVRNEPPVNGLGGSVRGVAQGGAEALERFRLALHEGPPSAVVMSVEAEMVESDTVYAEFLVLR